LISTIIFYKIDPSIISVVNFTTKEKLSNLSVY
jgi:hypothetical protein